MKRKLLVEVDCGDKTCLGCDGCNLECSPAECLKFSTPSGEGLAGVPLRFTNLNGGDWLRCRACLAAEAKVESSKR